MFAKYSVTLRELMQNEQTKPLLDKALSTYPMYKSTSKEAFIPSVIPTREELNKKILNYYKYREIGFDTVGRFLDELEISMNEIMPYYNQLFFSADQDYNIIFNVDYVKTLDTERSGEDENNVVGSDNGREVTEGAGTSKTITENESESQTNSKNIHADTPQDELDVGTKSIDSVNYADSAQWDEAITSSTDHNDEDLKTTNNQTVTRENGNQSTARGKSSGKEATVETIKGNFGVVSAQDLVAKYREIILNIEQMIINDKRIVELFMLVY